MPTQRSWNRLLRETLAAACLLGSAVVLATRIHHLPTRIHTPFNGGGDAHGLAPRDQLWLLLFIGLWIYVLTSLFNLLPPEAINSPRPLTPARRTQLLTFCKAIVGWTKATLMAGLLAWICAYAY